MNFLIHNSSWSTDLHQHKLIVAALCCCCLMLGVSCAADSSLPDVDNNATNRATENVAVGSCTLATTHTTDEDAIQAVIEAEAHFVVAQEIQALMRLWNEGAFIADAKHTPDDETDDQRWNDKDAIRHRYVRIVFPGAPTTIMPKDLVITIVGTQAEITATTQIGDEISPAGDRWVLSKRSDCWGIDSLTYNLETGDFDNRASEEEQ